MMEIYNVYSASGKELADINSPACFFAVLLEGFSLRLLLGLLRDVLREDTVYSGFRADLSSACFVVLEDFSLKNHL